MRFIQKIVIFLIALCAILPLCAVSPSAEEADPGYPVYRANHYAEYFAPIAEHDSFATAYYCAMEEDVIWMTSVGAWEALHIVAKPSYALQSGLLTKQELYTLAFFEMFGIDHSEDGSDFIKSLNHEALGLVFDLSNLVHDDIAKELAGESSQIPELAAIPVTPKVMERLKSECTKSKRTDVKHIENILSTAINCYEAIEMCATYQTLANAKYSALQVLEAIARDPDNPSDLRNAASSFCEYVRLAYDDCLATLYTKKLGVAAISSTVGILFDAAWGKWLGAAGGSVTLALSGMRLLANSVFKTDDKVRVFYQIGACVELEAAVKRTMNRARLEYLTSPTEEKAIFYLQAVECYEETVAMGIDYSLDFLQIHARVPGQEEETLATIKEINRVKAVCIGNYIAFEDQCYGYYKKTFSDFDHVTTPSEYVKQWNVSATASSKVLATLYANASRTDYTLHIQGEGAMKDWGLINYSQYDAPWIDYAAQITGVIIGKGVTNIGNWAFYDCSALSSLELPNTLRSIGNYTFENCTSLVSVTVPDSVTSLGNGAFEGCSALKTIVIGNGVMQMGKFVLRDCTALTDVIFRENSRLSSIDSYAFYGCTTLKHITIPDSVTSLGHSLFAWCSSLESLSLPFLGETRDTDYKAWVGYVFTENSSATYANQSLPASLKRVTVTSATKIVNNAFQNCSSLEIVVLNAPISTIGSSSFLDCKKLKSVFFPSTLKSIGSDAFKNCTALTDVPLPNSLVSLGTYAFEGCSSLTEIIIPDSLTSIPSRTFYKCVNLKRVVIGNAVRSIGEDAFYHCDSLQSLTLGNSLESIGEWGFANCASLTSVTIPKSLRRIGSATFYNCPALTDVYISDLTAWCKIQFGSTSATPFRYAKNLYLNGELVTDLVIPRTLTSIGAYTFSGCKGLTSVTIPSSIRSIGTYAFNECTALTDILMPRSVKSVGNYAFYGCSALKTVSYHGTQSEWNSVTVGTNNTPLTRAIRTVTCTLDGGLITALPTYTVEGIKTYTCTVCGGTKTEAIPVLAPDWLVTASVTLADDLSYNLYALLPEGATDAQMIFTFDGETVEADGILLSDGRIKYVFDGILPQQMGKVLTATLTLTVDGVSLSDSYKGSVESYTKALLADEALEGWHMLVKAMLNYGAAAQTVAKDTDRLVNEGITGEIPTVDRATISAVYQNGNSEIWTSAALVLDNKITLRIGVNAPANVKRVIYTLGNKTVITPIVNGYVYIPVKAAELTSEIVLKCYDGVSATEDAALHISATYYLTITNSENADTNALLDAAAAYAVTAAQKAAEAR